MKKSLEKEKTLHKNFLFSQILICKSGRIRDRFFRSLKLTSDFRKIRLRKISTGKKKAGFLLC